jgi:16S rRNA processing protein RimM
MTEERLLEIGRVVKAHGLRGELVVRLVTNLPDRIAPGERLRSRLPGRPVGELRDVVVTASRPFQHRYLVSIEAVTTREAAEALMGATLLAEPIDDPEALFVHDLIGSEVVEVSGVSHGLVVAVEANPASDLLVGEGGWLVPLRFVVERRGRQLVIDAPTGLFDD